MTNDSRSRPLEQQRRCVDLFGHELHAPAHLSIGGRSDFWRELRDALEPWAATPFHDWILVDTCKEKRRPWNDDEVHAAVLRVIGRYNLPAGSDYPAGGPESVCGGGL